MAKLLGVGSALVGAGEGGAEKSRMGMVALAGMSQIHLDFHQNRRTASWPASCFFMQTYASTSLFVSPAQSCQ